jgi:hypothetical protein
MIFNNILTMVTIIAPPSAGQKPVIINPCMRAAVSPSINALIIKVNRPRVRINRSTERIGFQKR